jgi:Flp pilus assembly protein TadD
MPKPLYRFKHWASSQITSQPATTSAASCLARGKPICAAVPYFRRASEADPTNAATQMNLGDALNALGQY